jgi:hypothetical protein
MVGWLVIGELDIGHHYELAEPSVLFVTFSLFMSEYSPYHPVLTDT